MNLERTWQHLEFLPMNWMIEKDRHNGVLRDERLPALWFDRYRRNTLQVHILHFQEKVFSIIPANSLFNNETLWCFEELLLINLCLENNCSITLDINVQINILNNLSALYYICVYDIIYPTLGMKVDNSVL